MGVLLLPHLVLYGLVVGVLVLAPISGAAATAAYRTGSPKLGKAIWVTCAVGVGSLLLVVMGVFLVCISGLFGYLRLFSF
jgi:hypothetical protein